MYFVWRSTSLCILDQSLKYKGTGLCISIKCSGFADLHEGALLTLIFYTIGSKARASMFKHAKEMNY